LIGKSPFVADPEIAMALMNSSKAFIDVVSRDDGLRLGIEGIQVR